MKTILLIMILSIAVFSESINAQTKYDMPLSGVSNKGTEFVITFHPFWEDAASDFVKLYIFSDQDTKVKVSVEGMNFSEEQEIKAFEQSI